MRIWRACSCFSSNLCLYGCVGIFVMELANATFCLATTDKRRYKFMAITSNSNNNKNMKKDVWVMGIKYNNNNNHMWNSQFPFSFTALIYEYDIWDSRSLYLIWSNFGMSAAWHAFRKDRRPPYPIFGSGKHFWHIVVTPRIAYIYIYLYICWYPVHRASTQHSTPRTAHIINNKFIFRRFSHRLFWCRWRRSFSHILLINIPNAAQQILGHYRVRWTGMFIAYAVCVCGVFVCRA